MIVEHLHMKRRRGEAAFLLLFPLLLFVESKGGRERERREGDFIAIRIIPLSPSPPPPPLASLILLFVPRILGFRLISASFLQRQERDYCTTRNSIQEESLRGDQSRNSF